MNERNINRLERIRTMATFGAYAGDEKDGIQIMETIRILSNLILEDVKKDEKVVIHG